MTRSNWPLHPPCTVVLIAVIALALPFATSPTAGADVFQRSWLPTPADRINHAPGFAELPSGRLLACWYFGTTEVNVDTVIPCASSNNSGTTWSAPRQVAGPGERAIGAAASNKSLGNIALYEDTAAASG
jgi:hypothetical protein